jgi:hypothetical protein
MKIIGRDTKWYEQETMDILVREELLDARKMVQEMGDDPALVRALDVVIAYYSAPGTYMEGCYDGRSKFSGNDNT